MSSSSSSASQLNRKADPASVDTIPPTQPRSGSGSTVYLILHTVYDNGLWSFTEVNGVYASLTNANNACRRLSSLTKRGSLAKIKEYQHTPLVDGCDRGLIIDEAGKEQEYRVERHKLWAAETEPKEDWDDEVKG